MYIDIVMRKYSFVYKIYQVSGFCYYHISKSKLKTLKILAAIIIEPAAPKL